MGKPHPTPRAFSTSRTVALKSVAQKDIYISPLLDGGHRVSAVKYSPRFEGLSVTEFPTLGGVSVW